MRLFVAIASVGRAETLRRVVDRMADQTRVPDEVVLSVTTPEDVEGMDQSRITPKILFSPKGSCVQRNVALDDISGRADAVVFFDDDFVPARDYLENIEKLMLDDPEIAGLTGDLVDDGIHGDPISFDDAVRRLDVDEERPAVEFRKREALYGCNMAFNLAKAKELRFDENLPLYGWQEDIDYTYQLGQRGKLFSGPQLTGIHLGVRGARQPGRRVGYSQVANIVYLHRKGTMQPGLGRRLLVQNLLSNAVRSVKPEAGIDRRGRLAGNLMAIRDWASGSIDPRRVLHL